MHKVFAQTPAGGKPLGPITGEGPFGNAAIALTTGEAALNAITGIVSAIIGFMTISASIWFILQFIIGGFHWMTSGGDKQRLHEAKERITNSFVGLIIVVAGWGILALAGQFFGYDILLPGSIITKVKF